MSRHQTIAWLTLLAALPATAVGQSFDLDWYTMDSGGVMFASGGVFELSGTIGQPDAGSFTAPLTGGVFELVGGFWPVAAGGCVCPGDLDGDCDVDLSDLAGMLSAFGCCEGNPCYVAAADINQDGCIDLGDLTVLLSGFGVSCS